MSIFDSMYLIYIIKYEFKKGWSFMPDKGKSKGGTKKPKATDKAKGKDKKK